MCGELQRCLPWRVRFRSSHCITDIVLPFAEHGVRGLSGLLLGLVDPPSSSANFGFIGMARSAVDNVLHVQRRKLLP